MKKKIIATALALTMTACMAVPAFAVTPRLNIDMPEISNIKIEPNIEETVYENAVNSWFKAHPIVIDWSKINIDWSKLG